MTVNLTYILSFSSVMKNIGGVLLAVLILLVMVTIHEFGHYVAGKILGFKINEFSVGFGPALLKKRNKKSGELFALRVIPLGGYCAFEGEDDIDEEELIGKAGGEKTETKEDFSGFNEENEEPFSYFDDEEDWESPENGASGASGEQINAEKVRPLSGNEEEIGEADKKISEKENLKFNDQPPWKRIIVLIAGATMNYLLALFIIVVMFIGYGRPHSYIMPLESSTGQSSAVVAVEAESDGSQEGTNATEGDTLKVGDVVLTVNGKDMYLEVDYIDALKGKKAGDKVSVVVLRRPEEGRPRERVTLSVTLQADATFANMSDTGVIYKIFGLNSENCQVVSVIMKQGFFRNLGDAFIYSGKLGGMVLRTLGELLTGKLGISAMGGPVTTISVTAQAVSYGGFTFFNIAALIGVNLAVFNLLPIPALDGSKVVFTIIEWIRKKPINRKVEAMIHFIGIIVLFGFAILVDVLHWVL